MKCAVAFFALLAGCSVLLGDSSGPSRRPASTLLEDLARMTRAGTPDATVLLNAKARRRELSPRVSDTDLQWLRDAGVGESVVRYMSAIDVRPSAARAPEGVSFGSERDRGTRALEDSSESHELDSNVVSRNADDYEGDSGYGYGDAGEYASSGYGDGDYGYDAYFGYPYFGYPFLYSSFPGYFFVGRDFFHRFPRRDRHDHGFDGGLRGRAADRGAFREAWRDRGARGRGGSTAAVPRGAGRTTFARGSFGRTGVSRGFGFPRSPRGNLSSGSGRPRAGFGFRNSAPSTGPRSRAGGFGRGSVGMSGGGRGRR